MMSLSDDKQADVIDVFNTTSRYFDDNLNINNVYFDNMVIVREPTIGLIKWLRPKGLKVYSYVEKYAEFKNQTLRKIGWYTNTLCATEYPCGRQCAK